jgi:hypothetical protein
MNDNYGSKMLDRVKTRQSQERGIKLLNPCL